MTNPGKDTASVNAEKDNKADQSQKPIGSVFEDAPAPNQKSKKPTEHKGEHGQNGRENDLDRAEQAGREDGRR